MGNGFRPKRVRRWNATAVSTAPPNMASLALTRALIEEGRNHLLAEPVRSGLSCPHHSSRATRLPLEHALTLVGLLGEDMRLTLVKDANRLSREQDLP